MTTLEDILEKSKCNKPPSRNKNCESHYHNTAVSYAYSIGFDEGVKEGQSTRCKCMAGEGARLTCMCWTAGHEAGREEYVKELKAHSNSDFYNHYSQGADDMHERLSLFYKERIASLEKDKQFLSDRYKEEVEKNYKLEKEIEESEKALNDCYSHPSKCPNHQCGGLLNAKDIGGEEGWKTPDLECSNCNSKWFQTSDKLIEENTRLKRRCHSVSRCKHIAHTLGNKCPLQNCKKKEGK